MRDARFCAMAASPLGVINTRWFDARSFATALTFVFLCSFLDRLILRAWCGAFFLVKLKEAMEAAKDRDDDAGVLANWRQTMEMRCGCGTSQIGVAALPCQLLVASSRVRATESEPLLSFGGTLFNAFNSAFRLTVVAAHGPANASEMAPTRIIMLHRRVVIFTKAFRVLIGLKL